MKLQALRDNLVLKPILASGVSAGGVVLPGAKQIEDGCIVVSIGPMIADLAVGDIVIRPEPPRYIVTDDDTGEELWISAEEDILARVICETTGFPVVDAEVIDGKIEDEAHENYRGLLGNN